MARLFRTPLVGETARDGRAKYDQIDRRPRQDEIQAALDAARQAGLWRFDERRLA